MSHAPAAQISFSGCKDSQTSADTYEDGAAAGAMSYVRLSPPAAGRRRTGADVCHAQAFISALKARPVQTYQELLQSVRKILKERYSQKPQLSSSHKIVSFPNLVSCCLNGADGVRRTRGCSLSCEGSRLPTMRGQYTRLGCVPNVILRI